MDSRTLIDKSTVKLYNTILSTVAVCSVRTWTNTYKMRITIKKLILAITIILLLLSTGAGPPSFPYSPAAAAAPSFSPEKAAAGLLKRLLPDHTDSFIFQYIPPENGRDVFQLESRDGKIVIAGNTGTAMASGLNWYLKYFCHCHISLNGSRLELPRPLPEVTAKIKMNTPFKYRNFFNYCTFSYTMAWWDWERWEKMIDYLALNGTNMPLAITGQEAVWQEVYKELGLSDKQVKEFLVGPVFLPWGWMGNIDGLGGPLPQRWIDAHALLQQKILDRERELGMTPVLQGFTGHVPAAVKEIFPDARIHRTTSWAGLPGTWFLDPRGPLFQRIGKSFIQKQTRLFGTDHLYDADCFNEINPHTNDPVFITDVGRSVYQAMQAADPEAIWVFQGWFLYFQPDFWKPPQAAALMAAVPDDRMLGLDLWGEKNPVWNRTNAFYGKPWIWNVFNLSSQNVTMGGNLDTMQNKLAEAQKSESAKKLQGIGMMMEGFGYNPVVQEFVLEKTWQPGITDLKKWAADYAYRRYGSRSSRVIEAWQLLIEGPYSRSVMKESIICTTPQLGSTGSGDSNGFNAGYDVFKTVKACQLLLECSGELGKLDTFRFDLTHVTREMLVNLADMFNGLIADAYENKNPEALAEAGKNMLQLIRDIDELLGTNEQFLLGKWIADARKWGVNEEEKDLYEYNARAVVTMWEPAKKSRLRDYASKQWNGLLKGFYLPRWELFLERLQQSLAANEPYDRRKYYRDLKEMELNWIFQTDEYPSKSQGDTIQTARRLFEKYINLYKK